jgi:hypothetical protein
MMEIVLAPLGCFRCYRRLLHVANVSSEATVDPFQDPPSLSGLDTCSVWNSTDEMRATNESSPERRHHLQRGNSPPRAMTLGLHLWLPPAGSPVVDEGAPTDTRWTMLWKRGSPTHRAPAATRHSFGSRPRRHRSLRRARSASIRPPGTIHEQSLHVVAVAVANAAGGWIMKQRSQRRSPADVRFEHAHPPHVEQPIGMAAVLLDRTTSEQDAVCREVHLDVVVADAQVGDASSQSVPCDV